MTEVAPIRKRMGAEDERQAAGAARLRHPHLEVATKPFPLTRRAIEDARSTFVESVRSRSQKGAFNGSPFERRRRDSR